MPIIKVRRKELTQKELQELLERVVPKDNLYVQIQVDGFAPTFYLLDNGEKIGTVKKDLAEFEIWINRLPIWVLNVAEEVEKEIGMVIEITMPFQG